jgi:hypothetical protein
VTTRVLVAAVLLAAFPAGARAQSSVTLVRASDPQLHLAQPTRSQGFATPLREVVGSKPRWDELWDQLLPDWTEDGYKRQQIDFAPEMAAITSVVNWDRGCLGGAGVTAPVDLVRMPARPGPVVFVEPPKRNPGCYD